MIDTFEPADYRMSKSGWLRYEDSSVISRLSRLIEGVTNMSMITAEDLHQNRITTWLTYFSDVKQSDATVFHVVGDHLKSKKEVLHFGIIFMHRMKVR
ncbi:unnamed protein product [Adineta steineri]|uniref:Uncharacterized protein n=1 Tax=Adineta steineri TaxID=433720 RepID=A0A815H1V2_9BILA|nr:unnamed protein product [Adineta steineri]CAF1066054.1 unnamed protein product [Adineta steineri]CAF1259527.1 unnamed protein product [Adineta steineri]CAF1345915.1 unnamed protein product [Adineta steineri]